MRPDKLLIEGLRSYRDPAEIDFSELGLTAIIGDTGAGKSSIIEALSVALYNCPTWERRGVQALRGDNVNAMRVVLTFTVGTTEGRQQWRVTRVHRKTGAPMHKLECVDTGETVDNEAPVNARIQHLIGLTHDQFTKAVVIPQGKFAKLLEATPTERTTILKGIFRLDHLTVVKNHAAELQKRYAPAVVNRQGRRAQIGDPEGALRDAEDAHQTHARRLEELTSALSHIVDAEKERNAATERGAGLRRATHDIVDRVDDKLASVLAQVAVDDADLRTKTSEVERRRADAVEVQRSAEEAAAAGLVPFASRDEVVAARSILAATATAATEFGVRRAQLDDQQAALNDELARETRREERDRATRLRADATALDGEQRAADAQVRGCESRLSALNGAVQTATSAANAAERTLEIARKELHAAIEKNALATVAGECTPGDPCPVCSRALPDTFVPPSDPAIDDARGHLDEANEVLTALRVKAAEDTNARDGAAEELTQLREALDRARGAYDEANTAAAQAETTADKLDTEADAAAERVRLSMAALERDVQQARQRLEILPDAYRVAVEDEPGANVAVDALDALLELSDDTIAAVETARKNIAAADEEARALSTRRDNHVNQPIARARESAMRLFEGLHRLQADWLTDEVLAPAGPAHDCTIDELTAWIDVLSDRTTSMTARAEQLAQDADAAAAGASKAIEDACKSIGAGDADAVRDAIANAQRLVGAAEQDMVRARRDLALAAQLDTFLAIGEPFVANLDVLVETLNDSRFVRALVAERERELLIEASKKLRELTNDNFGFAADFAILDRRTGQERKANTLSGGESFLASLALALALVEIATRGSGQLDALFLDEGFGSLDTASLDQALATLGTIATGGKLVALISHLHRVAEGVEHAMLVERDDLLGSHIETLSADALDRLLAEDARSGLTA